jgi:Fic family protein
MSFAKLDTLKDKLDAHRPLPHAVVNNLHEELVLQWTYNSNAIEGNTFSLVETKVALEGITVGGKTLREHFEVINHRDAILYVEDLVQQKKELSEWEIKNIHGLILKNIDSAHAGLYRTVNVLISGAQHKPPEAMLVPELMEKLVKWYQAEASNLHPVERAARIHADFVKIHPFVDGNGRTSRLLMNLELMKWGFPAAILPVSRRLEYYQALDTAHCESDYTPFIELISQIVERSFDTYWWALSVT